MSYHPVFSSSRHHYDPVARLLGGGALLVALLGLVFAMTGMSQADSSAPPVAAVAKKATKKVKKKPLPGPSTTPKKYGVLRLNKYKRWPTSVIPKVPAAKRADTLGGATKADLGLNCPTTAVDLGSWCLDASTYPVPATEVGRNDFAYAAKACVKLGGYLPTAAQLIGAADRVKLAATIGDNETTAAIDIDPTDGFKDAREMSASLFTVTSGSSAGGSEGVSGGSIGDPRQGEPNPIPAPADPMPETLNYVTVFDNGNQGGFAGGAPVGAPEKFRCAYSKTQGAPASED